MQAIFHVAAVAGQYIDIPTLWPCSAAEKRLRNPCAVVVRHTAKWTMNVGLDILTRFNEWSPKGNKTGGDKMIQFPSIIWMLPGRCLSKLWWPVDALYITLRSLIFQVTSELASLSTAYRDVVILLFTGLWSKVQTHLSDLAAQNLLTALPCMLSDL